MQDPLKDLGIETILGVWAHPDDETYVSAGVMASATDQNKRVVCVTATKGELGTSDPERWPLETIVEVREAEMAKALSILGIKEHHWLGYRDGSCPDADPQEATNKVAQIIAEVRPDAVLTFGPDGITGHPDHLAVSRWTSDAFKQAAPKGARLFYAAMSRESHEKFFSLFDRFNVFPQGPPPLREMKDLAINLRLNAELLDRKVAALTAHESQVSQMALAFGPEMMRESNAVEDFVLAATA